MGAPGILWVGLQRGRDAVMTIAYVTSSGAASGTARSADRLLPRRWIVQERTGSPGDVRRVQDWLQRTQRQSKSYGSVSVWLHYRDCDSPADDGVEPEAESGWLYPSGCSNSVSRQESHRATTAIVPAAATGCSRSTGCRRLVPGDASASAWPDCGCHRSGVSSENMLAQGCHANLGDCNAVQRWIEMAVAVFSRLHPHR